MLDLLTPTKYHAWTKTANPVPKKSETAETVGKSGQRCSAQPIASVFPEKFSEQKASTRYQRLGGWPRDLGFVSGRNSEN
jgi:hypothetical protein